MISRVERLSGSATGAESRTARKSLKRRQVGPYRLSGRIGAGGMGAVYKATHTKLNRIVAVKVLPTERLASRQAVGRFEREMKAVGKLDHPNIVRATDAGKSDGVHFLAMEYVHGINLSQLVRAIGPLPAPEAGELVRQAAEGLQYAQQQGLVHRDLKPSNLILDLGADDSEPPPGDRAPIVKILDMGLALLREESAGEDELTVLSASSMIIGTLDYMAPEQIDNPHTVDIRADIYGLGATLYKLLGPCPVFRQGAQQSIAQAHGAGHRGPAVGERSS